MITGLFLGLAGRLVFLHLSPHDSIDEKIDKMHSVEKPISVGRGRILDRNGYVFAIDLPARDIWINPVCIKTNGVEGEVAAALSRTLGMEADRLFVKIKGSMRRGLRIKRFVEEDVGRAVEDLKLEGVWTRTLSTRNYPHGKMLCHALGFLNWGGKASGGIEQRFNSDLKGRDGLLRTVRDGRRRELYDRRAVEVEPLTGSNIYLTIDQNIQQMVEDALDKLLVERECKGAWAVVQRVRTGEILAMASRPAFNLNEFRFSDSEERRNRAIAYTYEPGSTFKPLIVAAALNEGIVKPNDRIDCENGCWSYKRILLRDCHNFGILSVSDIVKKSSNIGAAKIALKLGDARLEKYLKAYRLGMKTGIELPGEEGGILHGTSAWSSISATRLAMGHELTVTAVQLLNAVCAIVNGGYLMQPTLIHRVTNAAGEETYKSRPHVLTRVVNAKTSAQMRRIMMTVTEEGGTGLNARVPGYAVGGKTGTAQKAIPGGYSKSAHMASFVGFLPAENPEIAMIVVVDEPQPVHFGGMVAAPVFREVVEQVVRYLHILPSAQAEYARYRNSNFRNGGGREL